MQYFCFAANPVSKLSYSLPKLSVRLNPQPPRFRIYSYFAVAKVLHCNSCNSFVMQPTLFQSFGYYCILILNMRLSLPLVW